jgi:hypothetical protein
MEVLMPGRSLSLAVAGLVLASGSRPLRPPRLGGLSVGGSRSKVVVVKDVTSDGAHSSMQIRAGTQVWDLTLAPPAATTRAGLRSGIIPVGATVTINGHRHVDPKRFEVKTERVTWNGKTFNVYPGRT